MINTILPVIVLKKIILLPHNELRLELEDWVSKQIIDSALLNHDNKLFVTTKLDHLEESTLLEDLPLTGVIATVKSSIELPNAKTRVLLSGLSRAVVSNYSKTDDIITALISEVKVGPIEEELNIAVGRK